jgi:hypothetical protein
MSLGRVGDLVEPFYGVPLDEVHQNKQFKPQITLTFREDEDDVAPEYQPLRMRVSFRLMNETPTSLTEADLKTIGNKIKANFAVNNGYRFKKGKEYYRYYEPEKGYDLRCYAFSKTEARTFFDKILNCQSDSLDTEKFTQHLTEDETRAYPTIPGNQTILGKVRRKPRRRPVGYCRFRYATADIWGNGTPIPLVDLSYKFLDPLVTV